MASGRGRYPVQSTGRNVVIAPVRFDTNAGNPPDGLVDPCGIAATSSPIARAAQGKWTLTLKETWTYVFCFGEHEDDTAKYYGKVYTVSEGHAAANVVGLNLEDANTGTDTDTNNKTISFVLVLVR